MTTAACTIRPDQLRKALPRIFHNLSDCQLAEVVQLLESYSSSKDGEVLATIAEMLVPETLGEIVYDGDVDRDAAAQVDEFQKKIGERIRDRRLKLGWSQEELAAKAGVNQSHISRLEIGQHTPSDLTVYRLAEALGVSPADLDPGL